MNDDAIERELREWLDTHSEPQVPASLQRFLLDLPRTEAGLYQVRRQTAILARAPRRDLALLLVAAVVAVALGASLIAGFGQPRSALPTTSSSAQATAPAPSAKAPSPITVEPYAGDFVPNALALADPTHLVLVGATGYGVGDGVVAVTNDAGHGWQVRRLSTLALLDVAAVGSSILATTECPQDTVDCNGLLVMSTDGGASWLQGSAIGLSHPMLLDQKHGWAASPIDLRRPSTEFSTVDGGQTWASAAPPCGSATTGIFSVEFATPSVGWAACVGDTATGTQAKELLGTSGGGTSWSVLALGSQDAAVQQVGSIPLHGQLGGISMLADGHGWLWTDDALYASSDGGRTWSPVGWGNRRVPVFVGWAALVGDDNGYALVHDAVEAHLIQTSDGGRSWTELGAWSLVVNPPVGPSPGVTAESIAATTR